jgi:hypothetical protein
MDEQIKVFWKENKEKIKTGTILVLAPIAAIGLMTIKSFEKSVSVWYDASEYAKKMK